MLSTGKVIGRTTDTFTTKHRLLTSGQSCLTAPLTGVDGAKRCKRLVESKALVISELAYKKVDSRGNLANNVQPSWQHQRS